MRVRLYLDTYKDTQEFCRVLNYHDFAGKAELVNTAGNYRVNAKSFLGCLLAHTEWGGDIWLETDSDIYSIVEPWVNVENGDGNYIHE